MFCCHADADADLADPLAELHMEDYDTDEEGEEMKTETASRLFGSGNPGDVLCMTPAIHMFTSDPANNMHRLTSCPALPHTAKHSLGGSKRR